VRDITRSAFYYQAKGKSKSNIQMMEMMGKPILQEPTVEVLTMQSMLEENGITAGYEQIRRLMRLANITIDFLAFSAGKVSKPKIKMIELKNFSECL